MESLGSSISAGGLTAGSQVFQGSERSGATKLLPRYRGGQAFPPCFPKHQAAPPDQPPHGCCDAGVGPDRAGPLDGEHLLRPLDGAAAGLSTRTGSTYGAGPASTPASTSSSPTTTSG